MPAKVYAMAVILESKHTPPSKNVASISAVNKLRRELLLQYTLTCIAAIATEKPGYTTAVNGAA